MATEARSQGQAAATGGGDEEQERQADRRAGQVDHGQAQERVAAMLDQGIPGRVQHRGAEDDAEGQRRHAAARAVRVSPNRHQGRTLAARWPLRI